MSDAKVDEARFGRLQEENKKLRRLLKRWYWQTVTENSEDTVKGLEAISRATRRALGKDRFNLP